MNIMTFDGGGILGIFPLTILERLEQESGQPLSKQASFFAGTSTGAIIEACLASGLLVEDIKSLYLEHGEDIFRRRWGGGFFSSKYRNSGLREQLEHLFGDTRIGELACPVLIPAMYLGDFHTLDSTPKPKFFSTVGCKSDCTCSSCNTRVVTALMETSAAPTYFPAVNRCIDGGVAANNPSMCALAEALSKGVPLDSIRLASFGCGNDQMTIKAGNWGVAQWATKIIDLLLYSTGAVPHYQSRAVLGKRYVRVDPLYAASPAMDDWREAAVIMDSAEGIVLDSYLEWFKESGWVKP